MTERVIRAVQTVHRAGWAIAARRRTGGRGWIFCAGAALLVGCAEPEQAEALPTEAASVVALGFPIADPAVIYQTIGVDHDPEVQEGTLGAMICTDYLGRAFPWCYDEHNGVDYMLEGGFPAMDAGSVEVLAAADGVVRSVADGNYDRCRVEGAGISCDGHPMIANHVILEHEGGLRTLYWHLKRDSVAVEEGQVVSCGDVLGLVGSSGYSSAPHLHFGVKDADDRYLDPYAGPYSQPESLWADQGPPEGLPEPGCTAR